MAALKTKADVARSIHRAPLSATEQVALNLCIAKAQAGERITREDICQAIGSQNWLGGTAAGILKRLEAKGHITRVFYQRSVQVCVDGVCTAAPSNTAPHWRHRPRSESCPTPTIQAVAQRSKSLWSQIEARAKRNGLSPNEQMLNDLWIANEVITQSEGEWGDV